MFVRFGVPDSLCYKPRQLGGGLPWNEPGTIPRIYHLGQGDRVQRYLAAPNSQYTISVSSSCSMIPSVTHCNVQASRPDHSITFSSNEFEIWSTTAKTHERAVNCLGFD